jgi:hypothetical protein
MRDGKSVALLDRADATYEMLVHHAAG